MVDFINFNVNYATWGGLVVTVVSLIVTAISLNIHDLASCD